MEYTIGIDIGSARSKGILLSGGKILSAYDSPSGGNFGETAVRVREELQRAAGITSDGSGRLVATGYGSKSVPFADATRTDISCHALGVHRTLPGVRTVIDVGDLASKVFRIDDRGNLLHFLLSGKCAGGSGRILQIIARVLQVKVEDIGPLSLKSTKRVDFNTGCVVFAESEAVSKVAEGVAKEDLLAGIHRALAAQLISLAERVGIVPDIALVGGGARDQGLVKALEEGTGERIFVPESPHMTAALGAAILAGQNGD